MSKPVIVLGSGGHAAVLVEQLRLQQREIIALVSPDQPKALAVFQGIAHWQDEAQIFSLAASDVELVNGIGALPRQTLRWRIFAKFKAAGYRFASIVAQSALISPYAELDEGVQIMSGAIVQTHARIGSNSIINSGAIIEHDCQIGENNHIAPGATLSGGVTTGAAVHIATGATLIQGLNIGTGSMITAGAVVTHHVAEQRIVYAARMVELSLKGES